MVEIPGGMRVLLVVHARPVKTLLGESWLGRGCGLDSDLDPLVKERPGAR